MSEMTPVTQWSPFQDAIFNWDRKFHLMVEAAAGCGKTTTVVEMYRRLKLAEPNATVLFLAFNVKIKDELLARGVPASTMNAFGSQMVRKAFPSAKLETNKIRFLCKRFNVDYKKSNMVQRCVDLMKSYLLDKDFPTHKQIEDIIFDFELTEDKVDYNLLEQIRGVFVESLKDINTIDFADQICYPIYHKMNIQKFDYVIVDEAQDMAPAKLELVARAVGNRFICVGDPYQAIYGFAGADSESMNKIRMQFDPLVLNLPVTYRCGKKIVAEAHKLKVAPPLFQAGDNNHEGSVKDISRNDFDKEVKAKDFVLCRVTAPLVSGCFKLIKKGVRAQILGRDVGKKLVDLIDKICPQKERSMSEFCEMYTNYKQREVDKLRKAYKDTQADNLEDQLECLFVFTEGCNSINEMKQKIEQMFDDTVNPHAVIFSTIHKSKGLEAERVFCLPYKAKPPKKEKQQREERNLLYVQITRAKNELFWVK